MLSNSDMLWSSTASLEGWGKGSLVLPTLISRITSHVGLLTSRKLKTKGVGGIPWQSNG